MRHSLERYLIRRGVSIRRHMSTEQLIDLVSALPAETVYCPRTRPVSFSSLLQRHYGTRVNVHSSARRRE